MPITEDVLSTLGIVTLKENLTANPSTSSFLQFAYHTPVTEFSGKFMLHARTTNVSFLYCYLYDANMQMLTAEGASSSIFLLDTPYRINSTVKYIDIYGRSKQQVTATASLFLVTDMLMGGGSVPFLPLPLFTDGKKYANTFIKELYIPSDIFETLGNGHHLTLYQARNIDAPVPLVNIVDRESFNATTNTFDNYFSANDYNTGIIELQGTGIFTGKRCYLVANWEMTWALCEAEGMVNNHEIMFEADIIKETASHLKLSPTIAACFKSGLPSREDPPSSATSFSRESFTYGSETYTIVENVNTEELLTDALSQPSNVVINLARTVASDEISCTNNFICNNVCDGWLKLQEHNSTISGEMVESGCTFEGNVLLRQHIPLLLTDKNIINSSYHPYTKGNPFAYVWNGRIDEKGNVFSELDLYDNLGIITFVYE